MIAIYPIVEGHGEVRAVPELCRRVAREICGRYDVDVLQPHRVPRGRMLSADPRDLKRAVELGARKISQTETPGVVLVLLDADGDCPAKLAFCLRSKIARDDVVMAVVVAKQEYEAWFLAAARSLRGRRGVSRMAVAPSDPEDIRGAKEYLEHNIFDSGSIYRPTVDQVALTAIFDLGQARSAPSFDKLCRDLCSLLST